MKRDAKQGVGGTVWNNGGTIKNLSLSDLVEKGADCSRSTERVCGVGEVILYKVASWDGRV